MDQTNQNISNGNDLDSNHQDGEMFYDLCYKTKTCQKKITCFKFKSRNHAVLCGFFSLMCTALLVAVIVPLIINSFLDDSINEQVVIDSTSAPNYDSWQTNTVGSAKDDLNIYYKVRFFDIQNPTEAVNGAKPVVVEVGPYTYNEYFYKFDITWDDHGNTVTSNTYRYYIYNAAASGAGLSEQDLITLPYPTVIGFEYLLNKFESLYPGINQALDTYVYQAAKIAEGNAYKLTNELYQYALTLTPPPVKNIAIAEIESANNSITTLFNDLDAFMLRSDGVRLLLKTLMCMTPNGVSTFYQSNPGEAWFGYPEDDLLVAMIPILEKVGAQIGKDLPWSVAVPGAAVNYTSLADARRRRTPDTVYTGKRNSNQVAQYIRYQNMSIYHTCINPVGSPQEEGYIQGVTFPSCAHYQNDWTEEQAEKYGYTLPFATDFANRIAGSDANMYGRPMRAPKQQVFVSDIYRSAYLLHMNDVDWNGVKVQQFQIQEKDTYNATLNPENAQYYSFGPTGILNCTKAANIPVFISYPQFYLGQDSLVEAIKGISPNKDAHQSYLRMEPETGLLVEAKKRLQVNYLMEDYYLPEANSSSIALAESACVNIEKAITTIGIDKNVDCSDTLLIPMITCLAQPSNWTFETGSVYFPYGWVAEEFELPASDAADLKSSLYMVNDLSSEIRFWGLIIAGICFAIIVAMIGYFYIKTREEKVLWEKYRYQQGLLNHANGGNDYAFNPEHGIPIVVEPLLGNGNHLHYDPSTPLDQRKSLPQDSYAFSG